MAEVVVFHHALGLTDAVLGFAAGLRDAGHTVHTPDLYDGRTFETIEDGMAYSEEIGGPMAIVDRARAAVDSLPSEVVYVGFSLGVLPAQSLAQTRPGARGAVLMSGCLPVSEFGGAWPEGVPVQVHGKEGDPFFEEDLEAARALVESAGGAELFRYPGEEHLFADSSLPAYDPAATKLLIERVLAFLERA